MSDENITNIMEDMFTDALGKAYELFTPKGKNPDLNKLAPLARKAMEQVIYNYFIYPPRQQAKKRLLGRIIVRNRHMIQTYDQVLEAETEAGWAEWSAGHYYEQMGKYERRLERAGRKLYRMTGYMIPEHMHEWVRPYNDDGRDMNAYCQVCGAPEE